MGGDIDSDNPSKTAVGRADSDVPVETFPASGKSEASYTHGSLNVPVRARSPDTLSIVSADDFSELRMFNAGSRGHHAELGHVFDVQDGVHASSWTARLTARLRKSWIRNKGLAFVLIAQICATMMGAATRVLEEDRGEIKGMNPFQILFVRMSLTFVLCMGYMSYKQVEHSPLGRKDVRWLLLARGVGGFFGVSGFYYSLQHLSLSDAVVLTFISPILTCWACSKVINEPFTRSEQIGGLISLVGVVLIARPTMIFSALTHHAPEGSGVSSNTTVPLSPGSNTTITTVDPRSEPHVTAAERLSAVGMGLVGVGGAVLAYTTIRCIGQRAHPLVSVNYFATVSMLFSLFALVAIPSIPFRLPRGSLQWGLLLFIGLCGFAFQSLLTTGLRYEKSSRATNMMFSSMVFAIAFDRVVWGIVPSSLSLVGSLLIVGSALVVALQKERGKGEECAADESDRAAGTEAIIAAERGEATTEQERESLLAGGVDGMEVDELGRRSDELSVERLDRRTGRS